MEGAKVIKGTQVLPTVMKIQTRAPHVSLDHICMTKSSRKSVLYSQNIHEVFGVPKSGKHIYARRSTQPLFIVVADRRESKYNGVGMPLEPRSPEGRLLGCILQNKKHLFSFAVSEVLDDLVSDRDEAVAVKEGFSEFLEPVLSRRIAEMKERERQVAVEDLMYMSIVHKFSEHEVPMVSNLTESIRNNMLEICPYKYCRELESIHSLEAQEMIEEYVVNVFLKSRTIDAVSTTKVDRIHLGRIYAATVLYGYFLKSVSFRRQMDPRLSRSTEDIGNVTQLYAEGFCPVVFDNLLTLGKSKFTQVKSLSQESQRCNEELSTFMGFDSELLQGSPKLKSKEAANVIEKHTWALFGNGKLGEMCCDNKIDITFPSFKRLLFEGATFGSFILDVERAVNSVYRLEAI